MDVEAKLPHPIGARYDAQPTVYTKRYSKLKALRDLITTALLAFFLLAFPRESYDYASDIATGVWRWPWTPRAVKTNIILLISDGYGPASVTFTRHFAQALNNDTDYNSGFQLALDKILVGQHRSRSSSSLITDSAAGATAFACAKKSYNGAIGVTPDGKPCGTVFEAAKRKGLLTGVVVTSRLTDATPAAFISHAASRAEEPLIASQMIGGDKNPLGERTLDLAIGGGGCAFLPQSSSVSCRQDDEDTVAYARQLGWDVRLAFPSNTSSDQLVRHGADLFADAQLPFMALLSPSNTPYDIDRVNVPAPLPLEPLSHYAQQALDVLASSRQNKNGFILMIEGSQIDLCAHNNDAACHAREALAYHDTIALVHRWVDAHTSKTERSLLISTSDHETGGVTLGRQLSADYPNYAYYPERLLNAKHSTPMLTAVLIEFVRAERAKARASGGGVSESLVRDFIRDKILGESGLGFSGDAQGGAPTAAEVDAVWHVVKAELVKPNTRENDALLAAASRRVRHTHTTRTAHTAPEASRLLGPVPGVNLDGIRRVISDIAARRAEIGFSTSGHTGIDINVYAHGADAHALKGNQDNTNIGDVITRVLQLDLDAVTRDLNK
ncbi:related to PHO8-repressible alkaline phosphatase vacuolar [Sporisorium reilianum f. sp. reilianum]|uniref:Alkaline phosphatase n=1 Tax=Sporisorium reilianum f. sp. reilianum TaxID=72559 RepID=A0A2N8UGG8_9BASI|nr:related to PHO8-repressible alkaline phosphatase vacuolar [Sporisorium reilianum f. sp. reilianum]